RRAGAAGKPWRTLSQRLPADACTASHLHPPQPERPAPDPSFRHRGRSRTVSDHLPIPPLPDVVIEPLVRLALAEDLGRGGDITTDAVIPASTRMRAVIDARE